MKPLTVNEIMQVLDKEILWCEQNPDKAFRAEYRKGFVNGLIQAKYLITETNNAVTDKGTENQRVQVALQQEAQPPQQLAGQGMPSEVHDYLTRLVLAAEDDLIALIGKMGYDEGDTRLATCRAARDWLDTQQQPTEGNQQEESHGSQ